MTVTSLISLVNGNLVVKGETVLQNVPKNVVLSASTGTVAQGVFLGVSSTENSSRHLFSLGVLKDVRFMCCFRFNLWWMTQRMGVCGRDVPLETQFLLLESSKSNPVYTVFLPLLDGSFRASLQGNENDELLLCAESGCSKVMTTSLSHSLFMLVGNDPFQVIEDAVEAVQCHMQTFCRRVQKQMPGMLNYFGWCTWDAFYTEVSPAGVKAGLKSLSEGGTPARFLIVDDGWQSVANDGKSSDCIEKATDEEQFSRRLTDIKENTKFLNKDKIADMSDLSMKNLVAQMKEEFALKYVYVWHALVGYWGGVRPNGEATQKYASLMRYPKQSADVVKNQLKNVAVDLMAELGVALIPPKNVFQFYNDYHSYLADCGVDGVKVDVQNILETLGDGLGGRVSLVQQYQQSLEASISQNFPDNGIIACMSHNNDGLYSIKNTAIVRASDDFMPRDPASHTIHIASVAYNSVFLGEFMQPDWDMFQSLHPAAEYHAASRAVGGCPVYVSDKPGQHNFDVLRKLVLPDGSILRAQLPGRPTKDSLFSDPARDGKSLLKIWNMNKHTGVVGVFNCQGAGWCKDEKIYVIHDKEPITITSNMYAEDVNSLPKIHPQGCDGECVVYSHKRGDVTRLTKGAALPVTLKVLEFDVFTVTPITKLSSGVQFAPIGLLKMFNSGGAVENMDHTEKGADSTTVKLKVHGSGDFGFYSSRKPRECMVDSEKVSFQYNSDNGLVTISLSISLKQFQSVVIEL